MLASAQCKAELAFFAFSRPENICLIYFLVSLEKRYMAHISSRLYFLKLIPFLVLREKIYGSYILISLFKNIISFFLPDRHEGGGPELGDGRRAVQLVQELLKVF
jgi:hypothetical protein